MTGTDVAAEVQTDLLRSAWIVERARALLYREWARAQPSFADSARRADARAEIVAAGLAALSRPPDRDLVEPHAAWLRSVAGARPDEVPLAALLVVRLADWIDAHAAPLLEGAGALAELGAEERAAVRWPERLPPAPPYEPVVAPPAEPPGDVVVRIAVLGDLHFGSSTGDDLARAAIADVSRSGADLVVQLGDITDHGERAEFEAATSALGDLGMPCVTMMGNHDVYAVSEQRLAGREYYPASFGREPDGVVVEHAGIRVAVLDSAEHGASPFAPFDLVTGSFVEGATGGAVVRGSLTVAQHDILADVAASGAPPAFLFLHHPPQPYTGFPPVLFGLRDSDSGRLHATCDSGNVWGVFAGHTHRNARTRTFGRVPAHEVAIPRDYPFGYGLLDVTRYGYAYRFVQISDDELVRAAYARAGEILRRYARGRDDELSFAWTPAAGSTRP